MHAAEGTGEAPPRQPRRLARAFLPLLGLLLAARPAAAGWSSLGNAAPPARDGAVLALATPEADVTVAPAGEGVIRVTVRPKGATRRTRSWAVLELPASAAAATVSIRADSSTVSSGSLVATVAHAPLRIAFASGGEGIDADDVERGTAVAGEVVRAWKRLRDDEHVYGFGEKTGPLDKRGNKLGGVAYAMWNSDTYGYDDATDPLYASIPFFLVLRKGRAHGVFVDSPSRTSFDVGKEAQDLLSFGADRGGLDYYLIDGPSPKDVLRRYTALTGRMPLPPLWALGYHQCRYSYYPEEKLRFVARNFRERRIPADVLWLDIHYQDGYRPFTWDRERFPAPERMIADLARDGFRTVVIVDPHPKKEPGTRPYDEGLAGGHFVKRPDGSVYEAPVWPSNAEKAPGPSVFPDFTRAATRKWWGSLHDVLVKQGVAGIWNDMNEPAVFVPPTGTFPLDLRHDGDGEPADHRSLHNVYGMLMSRATHEGLLALRPDARPFVLTRATYAGGQRWAALWPGDNVATWAHLQGSIPLLLGLGLSGMPFVGTDVGGFLGTPTAELYTRWLQSAVFAPFFRTHAAFGKPDQDPWSYGTRHEAANRRAIELRYELLPHVYNVMEEASRTGLPALRPLFLEEPDDPETWGVDDTFLFGRDLLVAPVLSPGAEKRWLYLPKGEWLDLATGERRNGGAWTSVPVTLDSLPVFVRAGAFVFRQPVVQHTGERAGKALRVAVYPGRDTSSGTLYEDAGETLAHRRGVFLRRTFTARPGTSGLVVEVAAPEGSWHPAERPFELWVAPGTPVASVRVDGNPLAPVPEKELDGARSGWAVRDGGWVVVRLPERFAPFRVELVPAAPGRSVATR